MSRVVPLREVSDYAAVLAGAKDRMPDGSWVPVSTTELHLACRFYPLAVSLTAAGPRLGLILDDRYLRYRLRGENGQWLGAYQPIGARCFPFSIAQFGTDPLADIVIDSDRIDECRAPTLLPADQARGLVAELHRLCGLLKRSEDALATALDQLLIADVLSPLKDVNAAGATLLVIDSERLWRLGKPALGALGRHAFQSIDVAMAGLFSLRNLKPEFQPSKKTSATEHALAAIAPDPIDDLGLALDDSELIGLGFDNLLSEPAAL